MNDPVADYEAAENMKSELRRVRAAMQTGPLPCCDLWCMNSAEFEIVGGSGHFEDQTLACEVHVGSLLGTPDWLDRENTEWIVVPLVGGCR